MKIRRIKTRWARHVSMSLTKKHVIYFRGGRGGKGRPGALLHGGQDLEQ
jgi:hypothetical protein